MCRCGVPSTPNHDWGYDGQTLLDDAAIPDMYRSDTGNSLIISYDSTNLQIIAGFAPCSLCPDTDTVPYRVNTHWHGEYLNTQFSPDSPCYCKAGYRSSTGLSPCQQCSPGSSTKFPHYNMYNANYGSATYDTGSTSCNCIQGYSSPTGNDNDGPCEKCPTGTTTIEKSGGTFFKYHHYLYNANDNHRNCL